VDKPDTNFGLKELDNPEALKQGLLELAGCFKRNVMIMELGGNMRKDKRDALLKPFRDDCFRKVARVFIGDPPASFQEEQKQMEIDYQRKKKKLADDAEVELPAIFMYRTITTAEMTEREIMQQFHKFTVPDEAEGIDEVQFDWQDREKAANYLNEWVRAKKMMQKVEGLTPSPWFKEKLDAWLNMKLDWRRKHREFMDRKTKAAQEKERKKKAAAVEKEKKEKEKKKAKEDKQRERNKKKKEVEKKKAEQEKRRKAAEDKGEDFDEEEVEDYVEEEEDEEEEEPIEVEDDEEEEEEEEEEGDEGPSQNDRLNASLLSSFKNVLDRFGAQGLPGNLGSAFDDDDDDDDDDEPE